MNSSSFRYLFLVLLLLPFCANGKTAKNHYDYQLSYLVDGDSKFTRENILSQKFTEADKLPGMGLSRATVWVQMVTNNYKPRERSFFLEITNPTISEVWLYRFNDANNGKNAIAAGQNVPYKKKQFESVNPVFRITLSPLRKDTFLLRIRSSNVILMPINIETDKTMVTNVLTDIAFMGIYMGIMMVMFLYNSFIYISVKDDNYLYYVFYILSVAITQFCLKGYAGKVLWPENIWLLKHSTNMAIGFSGVFSLLFIIKFLHPRNFYPLFYYICVISIGVDLLGIIISLFNDYNAAQNIFQTINGIDAIVVLVYGIAIYTKGYKPALFFNFSWFFFLAGVFIFILKDVGVLPDNVFTGNAILLGSGIEATLLSFALADKINIYKKEKEESQELALKVSRENESLVREQNIVLEYKVKERTVALEATNVELNKTLVDLKDAQTQLVESEKMASLGQLTAGIAHEINNPINFVTANINPLQRDIDMLDEAFEKVADLALSEKTQSEKKKEIADIKEDIEYDYLKTEIQYLLKGIREGSSRTAEIVKGLRIFSRVDEDDLKRVDIHEGIDATLVIINTLLNNNIEIVKDYGSLPMVDCYPGKLNQVFINIIGNGIHAIKKRWNDQKGGKITICTRVEGEEVVIKLCDNGTGMDETTMKRIFEPFYTTKDVGEGTGLGLSIVYNIMKKHNATINVESALGVGTTFIITLPINSLANGR